MKLVWGTVAAVREGAHIIECDVQVDDGRTGRAIVFPELSGPAKVGDRVLLNTTAVDLELGTGGQFFCVAITDSDTQPKGVVLDERAEKHGHIMKLRYTPMQLDVLSVESPESPYHNTMARVDSLEGVPVVCCGLHSQVPLVAAAIKARAPHMRVGYVMTDQAALSLNLSKVLEQSVEAGLIDLTISSGQSFGGELEAVNLYSGLLAACHVGGCDVIIAGIGVGVVGTATPFGHGGIAQGEAINAVAALEGVPIACLRLSFADERKRHQGISHHTMTALERVAHRRALIAVPFIDNATQSAELGRMLDGLDNTADHEAVEIEEPLYDEAALRGVKVTTMRRTYEQDPAFFEAAFAAGALAAALAAEEDGSDTKK